MSAIWGVAAFSGPLIGGFFADLGLWRWGFWSFAVQAGLLAVLVPAFMRPSVADETAPKHFPVLRLGFLSAAVLLVASAGVNATAATALPMVAAGALCFVLFLGTDARRTSGRMFP